MNITEIADLGIPHPDFRFIGEKATNGHPYVVFERNLYNKPAPEQITDYRERQETVERLGGRMRLQEYEIAGETPIFTEDDCASMRQAVVSALPDGWEVFESWNGAGSRSLSLGVRKRTVNAV